MHTGTIVRGNNQATCKKREDLKRGLLEIGAETNQSLNSTKQLTSAQKSKQKSL